MSQTSVILHHKLSTAGGGSIAVTFITVSTVCFLRKMRGRLLLANLSTNEEAIPTNSQTPGHIHLGLLALATLIEKSRKVSPYIFLFKQEVLTDIKQRAFTEYSSFARTAEKDT